MDSRRRLVSRVLGDGLSVSAAAKEAKVTRPTAYLWLQRAKDHGVAEMEEESRRPRNIPVMVEAGIADLVIQTRRMHPTWGSRKLRVVLWPDNDAPICERTIDRILKRADLLREPRIILESPIRFERGLPNELWQMDFKGLGENPPPYKILSVVDDCTRFLVSLSRISHARGELVFSALWNVLGQYGLPLAILSDNEHCFHCRYSRGPSLLEAKLWRLGISTHHGRPGHPQTQGKVERFHRTLQEDKGKDLRNPTQVDNALATFRQEYNWLRPHQAIELQTPGKLYKPSPRPRPSTLPESVPPSGCPVRIVDGTGTFKYQGHRYKAGKGLIGEQVALVESDGETFIQYANHKFATLSQTRTR